MSPTSTDRELLREVFRAARAAGWRRIATAKELGVPRESIAFGAWTRGEPDENGIGPEWVAFPYDLADAESEELTGPGMLGHFCDGLVVTDLNAALDLLAALDILPAELSSAYRRGRIDGMGVIHELSVETAADERIEKLWSQLKDKDALAEIGRDLDGLLDRDGFVRRAQVDLVVETVLKAAGMGA